MAAGSVKFSAPKRNFHSVMLSAAEPSASGWLGAAEGPLRWFTLQQPSQGVLPGSFAGKSCTQQGSSESAGVFRLGHAPSLKMTETIFGCRAGSVAGTRIGRLVKYP